MGLLLKCEHVDFGYENQDAVIDVSLEVSTGDYICIVGENGSGKSTLMKGILGLLKPTEGKIEISEELKKAGIGYLPQQTAAQKDFPATVFEVDVYKRQNQYITRQTWLYYRDKSLENPVVQLFISFMEQYQGANSQSPDSAAPPGDIYTAYKDTLPPASIK